MSTFRKITLHPSTGEWKPAWWRDDHFAPHHYGVQFDGEDGVYDPRKVDLETKDHDDLTEKEKEALSNWPGKEEVVKESLTTEDSSKMEHTNNKPLPDMSHFWKAWDEAESREDKAEFNRMMHKTFDRIREEAKREMLEECVAFIRPKVQKFVDKVENGRARSKETYSDMKAILEFLKSNLTQPK